MKAETEICSKCNGNGFAYSPKPGNQKQCRPCKGTGEKRKRK